MTGTNEKTTKNEQYIIPPTDVIEKDDHFVIRLAVPGVVKDHVSIDLDDDVLTIDAKVADYPEPTEREFRLYDYKRQFRIATRIETDQIEAKLENGLLTLVLPKARDAKKIKVPIS